jgi:pimeloyl-ACP methyl ester carboxylesterase
VPTADVNGITMYHEVHGDGPPLVLILGLATDVSELGGLIGGLAEHYRVLAFDNRGVGRTDKPDSPYSVEMMAEDTIGLMRATGFERAHVVGISLGGRIAMELTLRCPDMVARLALVSTAARVVRTTRRRLAMGVLARWAPNRGAHPQPRYAFEHQLTASGGWDGTDRLGDIRVPTVILHGRHDRIAPYQRAEELHAGIPGSTLITFRSGHSFLMMGEQRRFLDELTGFLGVHAIT